MATYKEMTYMLVNGVKKAESITVHFSPGETKVWNKRFSFLIRFTTR
jgi:hypothetical protein